MFFLSLIAFIAAAPVSPEVATTTLIFKLFFFKKRMYNIFKQL